MWLFKNWLVILFLCFCMGDGAAFYEKQILFYGFEVCAILWGGVCVLTLWLRRSDPDPGRRWFQKWKNFVPADIKQSICVLLSLLMALLGYAGGIGRQQAEQQWNSLAGRRILLEGAALPDSIRVKKEGISCLLLTDRPLRGKVRIFIRTEDKKADLIARKLLSEKIQLSGVLKEAVYLRNPGTYDGYHMDKVKEVYGKMAAEPAQLAGTGAPLPLYLRFAAASWQFRERSLGGLHSREAGLLPGMVLGGYQGVNPEVADIFRDNGMAHLLAVSGTHVAVLTAFLLILFRPFGKIRLFLIPLLLAGYALLCGLQPAVLRAGLMACVLLWGRAQDKKADSLRLLLLVALLLLAVNPFWLLDISFQLSFVTTAGLLSACPDITRRLPGRWPEWLRSLLGVTLTAQLFSLPFSVYYFHRVSLVSPVSNLVLLPALEAAVLCFLAGALFLPWLPDVTQIIFPVAEFLLHGAVSMGKILAGLPLAVVDIPDTGLLGLLCIYGCIAAWLDMGPFLRFSTKQRRCWLALMAATLLLLFGLRCAAPKNLTVHFMDVGQGDAALVCTPSGKNIMIDTGGLQGDADIARMVLLPYLRYLGVRQIDLLCLSHGDHDHAGGAAALAGKIPVKAVFLGGAVKDSEDVKRLLQQVQGNATIRYLHRGEQWAVGDCRIVVASASRNAASSFGATETNSASLVLQLFCQGRSLVFTGDADAETEENAVPLLRQADILKVSHHGSETSSSFRFLCHIRPRYGVISVGANNRYGHPARGAVERLSAAGITPLRTDQLGAVRIVFDGDGPRWYSFRYQGNRF